MSKWPSFIITTANDVRLISDDEESVVHKGHGLYYGLSWDKSNIYLLARNGVRSSGFPDVFVLDSKYKVKESLPGSYIDGHQIHCDGNKLFVTHTAANCIESIDLTTRDLISHNWTGFNTDINHINSIWKDGENFWVSCHYWERTSETGPFKASSAIKVDSSMSTILEQHTLGLGNHNIVRTGEFLYVCSSTSHEFIEYSLATREITRRINVGCWVRGVGITDNYIVLGTTKISGDRIGRLAGDSEVYLLDRYSLDIIDIKKFFGTGSIYELRLVGCEDYAHNGIEFPGKL